ncbi:MAG: RNA polymerase sigma factor [Myxococcales bacterium]|nr:RNA polymerase sigma factor [Myxococcales bacterium]
MDEDLEASIRGHLERGDLDMAATTAFRGYGPAVLRFLLSRTGDSELAHEAFSQLGEDVWRGLPGFRGRSSFMTWMFTVARNAAHRLETKPEHRRGRRVTTSKLDQVVDEVRERTAPYLRTDVKDRFRSIRESLPARDRMLLHLRLEEDLSWDEVARVVEGDAELTGAPLRRASMRLRKQYSDLRVRLRRLAESEGLLAPSGEE